MDFFCLNPRPNCAWCGVGESRTPVQTGNQKAFYTLSCRFDFRRSAWPTAATQRLASKIFEPALKLRQPYSRFTVPLNWTPQDKASKENPAFLPCRSEANLTMIQIKQQERSYFRRLKVRNNDVREQFHFPACLLFNSTCCQNQSTPKYSVIVQIMYHNRKAKVLNYFLII